MTSKADKYGLSEVNAILGAGFLRSFQAFPNVKALHINGKYYDYNDLFQLAKPISEKLILEGTTRVGILCKNDLDSYVNIIAAAISGICYVPLNAKFPVTRLKTIADDCGLISILGKDEITHEIKFKGDQNKLKTDLAYIIYTSGSTGIPKGVGISRKNINSFFNYYYNNFDFNSHDRFLQPYELSFDVSVFSMFCAWNAGACVYVVPDTGIKYIEILKCLQEHKITVCSMVPGILKLAKPYLKDVHLPELVYSFFSGDALYHSDAKAWKRSVPNASILNFYGPTETTIVCTGYEWNEEIAEKESRNDIVPIGRVFKGNEFILLNENDKLIEEKNEVGELCFNGDQIIEAYINDQSPKSFIKHNNKTFYRTGDLASQNEQYTLIFHGRKDSQVKISGYRVEILEIENTISQTFNCNCKVICEVPETGNRLVAYIENKNISKEELNRKLNDLLPGYMIPSQFFFIDQFPKNINDKLDMEKLKSLIHE